MHDKAIQQYIQQKADWAPNILQPVDWPAHRLAFCCLTRLVQILTSKLIHSLVNMYRQNKLLYGTSHLCTGCQSEEETLHHVLICSYPPSLTHRTSALALLSQHLSSICTPEKVIQAILHGFQNGCTPPRYGLRHQTWDPCMVPTSFPQLLSMNITMLSAGSNSVWVASIPDGQRQSQATTPL
jgi:hypothetical protein